MKKRNPKKLCYAVVNGRRTPVSIIGFEMVSEYSTPIHMTKPDDVAEISCRIVNGVTAFTASDEVVSLALKYSWYWRIILWAEIPGVPKDEQPRVEFKTDGCVRLADLSGIVQETKDSMGEDYPDSVSWGWSARIVRSPV